MHGDMKDAECAESKEKSYLSDFYSLSYSNFCTQNCQFSMNIYGNSKIKIRKLIYHLIRIFHENGRKTEREGGANPYLGQGLDVYSLF